MTTPYFDPATYTDPRVLTCLINARARLHGHKPQGGDDPLPWITAASSIWAEIQRVVRARLWKLSCDLVRSEGTGTDLIEHRLMQVAMGRVSWSDQHDELREVMRNLCVAINQRSILSRGWDAAWEESQPILCEEVAHNVQALRHLLFALRHRPDLSVRPMVAVLSIMDKVGPYEEKGESDQ